jgi:hypothetical protein
MIKIDYALSMQESLGKNESKEKIMAWRCPSEYGLENTDDCKEFLRSCDKCWNSEV